MLIPDEIARRCDAEASLLCAVTSIRRAPVVAIQKDAKRYSFSQRFCSTNANFSRLWRGLEQTAFKFLKHVFSQRSIMRHTRKTIGALRDDEGINTVLRRNILVKSNSAKSFWNQGFSLQSAHKHGLSC